MKKSQLIGFGIAGVAAVAAFILVKGIVNKPPPPPQIEERAVNATEVLVARIDLPLGEVITDAHFQWQIWPTQGLSRNLISKERGGLKMQRDLVGRITRAPIMMGEPITENKVVSPGEGGVLAAILPQGMRAISVRVRDEEKAVGRLILPNDHVDVIMIRRVRGRGGAENFVSDTLFTNVRVLAIGQQIETKEGKKTAQGSTATLELTPKQTELLALGQSMGDIILALRSVADIKDSSGPSEGSALNQDQRGNAIRILRYGTRSRAYGVN